MIFPGDIETPEVIGSGSVGGGVVQLFQKVPDVSRGLPDIIDLSDAEWLDDLSRGDVPPVGSWQGHVDNEISLAIAQSTESFFGLSLQKMGMIGNGKVVEGIGGLASDLGDNPNIKKAFEKALELPPFSQGLGTAQYQTARMYGAEAVNLVQSATREIGAAIESGNPNQMVTAVSSTVLGAASAVLMMVPSPFGITQIIGGVLTAVNALVRAFVGGTDREKIAKAVLYQASIRDDAATAKKIQKDFLSDGASGAMQDIALARGGDIQLKSGVPCDLTYVFKPKYAAWQFQEKRGRKTPWTGYQEVRSAKVKRNVAAIFEAGIHQEGRGSRRNNAPQTGYGFMPGTMRMQLQMQVPFEPMEDRQGNVIRDLHQFKKPNNDKRKNKDAIPFRELETSNKFAGRVTRPFARDLGADFAVTNNLCSQIWSTAVNRPGPLMYSIDTEEVNDAWRYYFESFYDAAGRWWSESKGLAWRATVLKVCSLMMVDWDPLTCSWKATGESNWMGQSPKDKSLNLKWSHSIYEQIIRPSLINLASRQYEYLHTSVVAYLPKNAAAYNDEKSILGKTFRDAREWLAQSELKQYLSMDDVIDPEYRARLGPSAGSKASKETPVIFALADGLTIPAPRALDGGAPGAEQQSQILRGVTMQVARRYGSSSPLVQGHMNVLEECAGRGPEGQGLRTLCEGAIMYDLLRR